MPKTFEGKISVPGSSTKQAAGLGKYSINPGSGSMTNSNSKAEMKCTFLNCRTKKAFTCQFNPTDLPRQRSYKYSDITSPGIHYPVVQFVSGESQTFDIELFFYDRPFSGKIPKARKFFNTCVPQYTNTKKLSKKPSKVKFVYGKFICDIVITAWKVSDEWRDSKGRVISVKYTFTVRRV